MRGCGLKGAFAVEFGQLSWRALRAGPLPREELGPRGRTPRGRIIKAGTRREGVT